VRVLVIRPLVSPDVVELPDRDNVPCRAPRLVWPDRLANRIRRASAVDRLERVAVGRLALVGVLERPWYSGSADVLDGVGCWR
jgi:hypothetical protein